jgi:cyclin B
LLTSFHVFLVIFAPLQDVTNSTKTGGIPTKKTRMLSAKKKTTTTTFAKNKTLVPTTKVSNTNFAVPRKQHVTVSKTTNAFEKKSFVMKPSWTISADSTNPFAPKQYPDDIDTRASDDPLAVTEYVNDMYALYREQETSISSSYMETQSGITARMRNTLVDWLINLHCHFRLCPDTLYLTVHIIDRFLKENNVRRGRLQLVGVAALLIASKYEDIYHPPVHDLSHMTDNSVSYDDILSMEIKILKALNYQISKPTAHAFLMRFTRAAHADMLLARTASYILEGTLVDYDLIHYLPSELAAASVYIARRSCHRSPWSATLDKYAGYTEAQVTPIARAILHAKSHHEAKNFDAVDVKYSQEKFSRVSEKAYPIVF